MFPTLDTRLVVMAMRVLPAPRWAALSTRDTVLKPMPPMMICRYSTAYSWVSGWEPTSFTMGLASSTKATLTTTVSRRVTSRAMRTTRLAPSRSPSPLRRATTAETATFMERKMARPRNFGWVLKPTAAMA